MDDVRHFYYGLVGEDRPTPAATPLPAPHPGTLIEATEELRELWSKRQAELKEKLRMDDDTLPWHLHRDATAAAADATGGGERAGGVDGDGEGAAVIEMGMGGAEGKDGKECDEDGKDRTVGGTSPLRLVGGVDISFVKGNDVDACASLVVLSYPDMKVRPGRRHSA